MAITRAQQVKQMLRDGGVTEDISFSIVKPSKDGKRPGYFSGLYGGGAGDRGGDPYGSAQDNQAANRTDSGNVQRAEDYRRQQSQTNIPKPKPKPKPTTTFNGKKYVVGSVELKNAIKEKEKFDRIQKQKKELSQRGFDSTNIFGNIRKKTTDAFLNRNKYAALQKLGLIETPPFTGIVGTVIDGLTGNIPEQFEDLSFQELKDISTSGPYLGAYNRNEKTFAKGLDQLERTMDFKEKGDYSQSAFDEAFPNVRKMVDTGGDNRGDGANNNIIPISSTTTSSLTPVEETVDNRSELEKLLDARGAAYRFFADGGRVPAMAGGIMNTDVIGGAADGNIDEMGRQMYFIGKLVKKATRAVKKIVKSPVGKIALLTAGAGLFGAGPAAGLFGSGKGLAFKQFLLGGKTLSPSLGFKSKGLIGSALGFAKSNPGLTIAGLSSLPFLFPGQEEEEEQQYEGPSIDIPGIRRDPYRAMGETYRFYAEGGKAEPVAKKTMPLIDMDGKEMDLRDEGGFVPLGRMERADDVPARLSKNEFVFTADAVRNAGEGDIDKGAEVMYNMMKNLESGGEVSEESQGLDGAREMFKTSQRLEEVL